METSHQLPTSDQLQNNSSMIIFSNNVIMWLRYPKIDLLQEEKITVGAPNAYIIASA